MTTKDQNTRGLSSATRLWDWLTQPTAAVKDFETRLKSRWLATLFLVFVPFGLALASIPRLVDGQLPWENPKVQIVAGLFALLSVSYFLSRRGHYKISAVIIIIITNLTVYGILLTADYHDPVNLVNDATYLIALVLFGNVMLSQRAVAVLLAINVVALLLQSRLNPVVSLVDIVKGPLSLLVLTYVLVAFGAYLRNALEHYHVTALQAENAERRRVEERLGASLQEKEILLKEIHHRVKNNLQIISSLLNLQSAKLDDPRLRAEYQDSQNRIRSMALIHEQLYRSDDLAHIDFGNYLRDLTGSLTRTYGKQAQGITVEVEADIVLLDIDTAIPCGLLVNELVSNALKHAFPDGRRGTVTVALRREPAGQVWLAVRDDGVGFPAGLDYRQTSSLGLQLVNSLARQLGATLELSGQVGTQFGIRFGEPSRTETEASA